VIIPWKWQYGHVDCYMTINVTDFKARCLEILRQMEETGVPVTLIRRGSVIGVIYPGMNAPTSTKPWERLRGTASLLAEPGESVLSDSDFEALR